MRERRKTKCMMQTSEILFLLSFFLLSDSAGGQGRQRHLLRHRSSGLLRHLQPPQRGDDDGFMTDFFSRFPNSPFLTGESEFGRNWSFFPDLREAEEDFQARQFAPKESFRHRTSDFSLTLFSSPLIAKWCWPDKLQMILCLTL